MAFSAKVDDTGEHLENFSFSSKNDEDSYARFIEKAIERYDGDGKDDMPGLKIRLNIGKWIMSPMQKQRIGKVMRTPSKSPISRLKKFALIAKLSPAAWP